MTPQADPGSVVGHGRQHDNRLAAVERQIALLYAHFGLDPSVADTVELPVPSAITALVRDGKKVTAIKEYRKAFDANLADATRAVGRLHS